MDVYIDKFENVDYDDIGQLLLMKTDELISVTTETSIEKPGQRKRFISAIEILKSPSASLGQASSSTSLESKNSGNDKNYIENQEDMNATRENDPKKSPKLVQDMHIPRPVVQFA